MRISDWSSDVCSSDLAAGFAADYAPDLDIRGAVTTGTPYVSANDPEATSRGGEPNRVDPAIAYTYYLTLTVQQTRPEITDGDIFTEERKSTRLNSSHSCATRRQSSA